MKSETLNGWIPMPKKLLFPEMRVTRKSSPGRPRIYFFNRFSEDILFPSLVPFAVFVFLLPSLFLYSCSFLLVCLFFKIKKIIFTRPISGNKTNFFGPNICIEIYMKVKRKSHTQDLRAICCHKKQENN